MKIPQKSFIVALVLATLAFGAAAQPVAAQAAGQQDQAQQAPAPKQLPRDGFPLGPSAKILGFTASAVSIQAGQSVTLKWEVINADRIELDQGIGIVATRDSRAVTPATTTTYTLLAKGANGTGSDTRTITVTVTGSSSASASAPAGEKLGRPSVSEATMHGPAPRMPDGKPDLNGLYIAPYHSIKVIGDIKLIAGAEKYKVGPEYTFSLGEVCLPRGVPDTIGEPYPIQIVQTPTQVVILYEAGDYFRVIPMDGRDHPKDLDPTWMGNSVGHWDGDTLVVDVIGVNDKVGVGEYRHTTAYHLVERFERTSYDTLKYSATIDDPNVFAAPWTEAGTFTLHPEWDIQEYICEENNHDYKKLFEQYKK
jgi:PKD repeat protein